MPTLSFTIGKHPYIDAGNIRLAHGRYTGPASYTNPGGDAFAAADVKLSYLTAVLFGIAINAANDTTRLLVWKGSVVRWFVPDTGAEVANATDVSGFTAEFLAVEG